MGNPFSITIEESIDRLEEERHEIEEEIKEQQKHINRLTNQLAKTNKERYTDVRSQAQKILFIGRDLKQRSEFLGRLIEEKQLIQTMIQNRKLHKSSVGITSAMGQSVRGLNRKAIKEMERKREKASVLEDMLGDTVRTSVDDDEELDRIVECLNEHKHVEFQTLMDSAPKAKNRNVAVESI